MTDNHQALGAARSRRGRRRLKILLTEGSSTSARQAVYCLGHQHIVDLVDPSPFCQARFSRLVRRWYRCPSYSADPRAYLRFLVQLLRQQAYDVLFPTHEQVYLLARVRERLVALVGLAVPEFTALDRVQNKAHLTRLLEHLQLPMPETRIVRSREELLSVDDLPRYIKLAHGTAGQAVWLAADQEALLKIADRCTAAGVWEHASEVLVQQPVHGVQEDVGGMFQHGRLVQCGGMRGLQLGVGGAAMQRESCCRPELREHIRRLGEHLGWHGPLGLTYIRQPDDGQVFYLEACPRIGETVNGWLAGINLCELVVRASLHEPLERVPDGVPNVRTHQTFVQLISLALGGSTRRQLAGELWQSVRGAGRYRNSHDELTRPRDDWLSVLPAAAVTGLLLAYPPAAAWLVSRTVANYSLPGNAAEVIRQTPDAAWDDCFR